MGRTYGISIGPRNIMDDKIKTAMKAAIKFFKTWNELLLGPLGILVWLISPWLIREIDPTAATFDFAVFQKIIFALVAFCVFSFSSWMLIRIQFPAVFRYLANQFDQDFDSLNQTQICERLKLSLFVLAYYLLGLVLCGLIL